MPSREQRVRVWRGELKKTTGGLTKDDLVKNKKGKIVSRRKSRQAAEQNNLGEWLRDKGDRFQDMPQAHAAKGLKAPKPKQVASMVQVAKKPKPRPRPRIKPKLVKAKPFRHKVDRDAGLAPGLRKKPKKKPIKLHAGEPQPEYVKFKEDLGRSKLKVSTVPDPYAVRKDPVVESAPLARNKNERFSDISVSNVRRSSRRTKRIDYSKYFD
jgi:hypothetical protein